MASMSMRVQGSQRAALSPRLQRAVALLQLSAPDFAQAIRDEIASNPFLEPDEQATAPQGSGPDNGGPGNDGPDSDRPGSDRPGSDEPVWHAGPVGRASTGGVTDLSALDNLPLEPTLTAHLREQLHLMYLNERELLLAEAIVASLDDDGYLRSEPQELIPLLALSPPVDVMELELALHRVQRLDPAGVGARDPVECLLLQLPAIEDARQRSLMALILREHLCCLTGRGEAAQRPIPGARRAEVADACARIRRLDPHPGWRFGAGRALYIVPDVLARRTRNGWAVALNPATVPGVRLNRVYADLLDGHRARFGNTAGDGMVAQLREARWMLRTVQLRCTMILQVASDIVRRQQGFFEHGPLAMRPMSLRDVADATGLHESTVSRATRHKFIAAPSGVIELKRFFGRPMTMGGGAACSGVAIRQLVREMIEGESPQDRLSDAEIARRLARQGLDVARRTVTQYRQQLRIEPAERRAQGR